MPPLSPAAANTNLDDDDLDDDDDLVPLSEPDENPEDSPDLDLMTDGERAAYEAGDDAEYDDADEDEDIDGPEGEDDGEVIEREAPAQAAAPEDFKARLAEVRAAAADAKAKWQDGDLSDDDYTTAIASTAKAEAAIEFRATEDAKGWSNAVTAYRDANPLLWASPQMAQAFDDIVGDVTSNARYAALPYAKQLAVAHNRLASEAGVLGLKDVPRPGQRGSRNAPEQVEAPQRRHRPEPPPTLARMPSSDMTTAGDGRFAALDRLSKSGDVSGMEKALARMSPEDRDAYGSGADL